jgi:hypothetical protein
MEFDKALFKLFSTTMKIIRPCQRRTFQTNISSSVTTASPLQRQSLPSLSGAKPSGNALRPSKLSELTIS